MQVDLYAFKASLIYTVRFFLKQANKQKQKQETETRIHTQKYVNMFQQMVTYFEKLILFLIPYVEALYSDYLFGG